jgi:Fe2+ or Zn2+ uptake regulation protein
MLLIFGTRAVVAMLATVQFVCGVCRTNAAQRVFSEATKFTLFFIPTFTLSTRHYVVCTNCGATVPISREQAEAYQKAPQVSADRQSPLPPVPTAPFEQVPD